MNTVARKISNENNSLRLYLAGPMRNYERFNFDAFFWAQNELEHRGYTVYNPAEEDIKMGFDPNQDELSKQEMKDAILHDIMLIMSRVDLIAVLDGWEESKGAILEIALANFLGIPCLELEEALDLQA